MTALAWLDPHDPNDPFPPVEKALKDPDGLLAVGGDLQPQRLLNAYRHGIFPWFEDGQPILWWSPDPRAVIHCDQLRISRSLRKTIKRGTYRVTLDTAFERVMQGCAAPRKGARGTWITSQMVSAYATLNRLGHAHSVEVWNSAGALVGGLYGVLLERVFSGESMFSLEPDTSKIALVHLAGWLLQRHITLIDCQLPNPHLTSLGATTLAREAFVSRFLEP
ncbi:MAG: leucyl/phenylalanyl-tRNA--protein transferase [Thiotrichales bacterium]